MLTLLNSAKHINPISFCWTFYIVSKLKMTSLSSENNMESNSLKRDLTEPSNEVVDEQPAAKIALLEKQERIKRRKVAMLISYLGQGYLGLQRNPGTKTIEEDLLAAMLKAGYINEEIFNQPQVIQFQRAARTDKGVSALRQILSLKLPENSNTEEINKHLPEQIRAIAMKRVTKGFNCKGNCDARTYSYTSPTFAFCPFTSAINEEYRLDTKTHDHLSEVLKMFQGTHNYHNFTSKKLPTDPSAHRYIINFTCGEPFVMDTMEFVTLKVKGQSFMQHQIRKMVGLTIAIIRGMTSSETLTRSWDREKLDIPIAPGLGLLLEEVHYDRYNQKFGGDGMHVTLDWSEYDEEIEGFNKTFILPTIVETEKKEQSMLSWLDTLNLHSFDVRTEHIHSDLDKALEKNEGILSPPNHLDALLAAAHAVETAR